MLLALIFYGIVCCVTHFIVLFAIERPYPLILLRLEKDGAALLIQTFCSTT